MNDKIILSDVDGVLCNWEWAFNVWMSEHAFEIQRPMEYDIGLRYGIPKDQAKKLVKIFNESAAIGFLPALRDSVYYVKRLHEEHGYEFHVITSLSSNRNAQKLRQMNLEKLFGDSVFTRYVILETGADKDEALAEYHDSQLYFVEDKPENCESGLRAGVKSLLMEHGFNLHYYNSRVPIVKNWREIYKIIIGEEQ